MSTDKHALVVDDNRLNSKLAGVLLGKLGWQVRIVDSGEAALQALREGPCELVLLDLRMPHQSGEQICRRIRDELGLADLHIVAYTAHGMPEEKQRMLAAGFNGLLIKPISFADVKAMCAEVAVGDEVPLRA